MDGQPDRARRHAFDRVRRPGRQEQVVAGQQGRHHAIDLEPCFTLNEQHPFVLWLHIFLPLGKSRTDNPLDEQVPVAQAKGVALKDGFAEDRFAFIQSSAPGLRASMAVDLERGNRLELDWLTGKVVALGRELGVPVPMNEAVYALLKPYRMGKPQS